MRMSPAQRSCRGKLGPGFQNGLVAPALLCRPIHGKLGLHSGPLLGPYYRTLALPSWRVHPSNMLQRDRGGSTSAAVAWCPVVVCPPSCGLCRVALAHNLSCLCIIQQRFCSAVCFFEGNRTANQATNCRLAATNPYDVTQTCCKQPTCNMTPCSQSGLMRALADNILVESLSKLTLRETVSACS